MANKLGHRRFGNIRRLLSGRYQIRYPGPDGRMRTGAETYDRLSSAKRALTLIEAQLVTGGWTDPVGGKVRLRAYAERWICSPRRAVPAILEIPRCRSLKFPSWLSAQRVVVEASGCGA
jgi:hypothetical protein